MRYDLNDKVVLITGASGGIGAATARALYDRGAYLVLADHNADAVERLAGEFDAERVLAAPLDVTDAPATRALVARAVTRFTRVDVVIANAGIAWRDGPATLSSCDEAEFERIVDVDLFGVWRTVRAALPEVTRNRGQILITSSIYALLNGMANAPYAASKAAVATLGRTLRTELAGTGASAGVIYPGWTATPIAEIAFGGNALATRLNATALPRLLRARVAPETVAEAIVAGLQRRAPRIVVPARWRAVFALRGVLDPLLDRWLDGHTQIHGLLRQVAGEKPRADEPRGAPAANDAPAQGGERLNEHSS
ncbi:SDR family NAD(P)-dependent oxidoreductase [Endozoicomonas sp. G2_2]|uniref:SDR family NAD(P)-dependent oxidoreductase n=1 Tax=Endozoicomonas sp. G2_2 TaxID=2821092 RepID=UPI001ADD3220|nr:SDR family NAD(P)-dependent oxidoreductase [Endozoicomonas sp. G2_2]